MSTEKMRGQFESWWRETMNTEEMGLHRCEFPMTKAEGQPYACHETNRGWMAWQASRAAIEVELPIAHGAPRNSSSYQEGIADGFESGVYRCQEAVESLGLRIKP